MEKTLNHTLPDELVSNDLALSSTEPAMDNQRKGKRGNKPCLESQYAQGSKPACLAAAEAIFICLQWRNSKSIWVASSCCETQ